jgi:hypothetical protein
MRLLEWDKGWRNVENPNRYPKGQGRRKFGVKRPHIHGDLVCAIEHIKNHSMLQRSLFSAKTLFLLFGEKSLFSPCSVRLNTDGL